MTVRRRLTVWGAVQGVGFRPFAFTLAQEVGLSGYVANSPQGAELEVEGEIAAVESFADRLRAELPEPGFVAGLESVPMPPTGDRGFVIRESVQTGGRSAVILPDIAPCARCLAEMHDPKDRRYRYPFINCTHCGPRYSIVRALPYDRPNTSMSGFPLCADCRREYEDPMDRRFHAQPVACPACGPRLAFWGDDGLELGRDEEALQRAAQLLRDGGILALKGVGGFHLMVDARDEDAVSRLRARKHREAKPLAVMASDLPMAESLARIAPEEASLLASAAAPIVILPSRGTLAPSVSPDNPNLGLMLPSSPLHFLLMEEVGFPVVATSGNRSDEPICTDEHEALARLSGIADSYLVHDRPILRPIDDSVCRRLGEGIAVLRRARGYAPLSFPVSSAGAGLLATGAHMKGSVALALPNAIVVGQHVGDLDHPSARNRMREESEDLAGLFETEITEVACDLHPDYASSVYAESFGKPLTRVQHHVAHAISLLAEHQREEECLVVVWDGTGLGPDGTIWGGEFLRVSGATVERFACLRPFPLPGGDAAARQGSRSAWGALFRAYGEEAFTRFPALQPQDALVHEVLRKGVRCIGTTSAGRLFDAAAALGAGIVESRFEGDAAMRWEALADESFAGSYPMEIVRQGSMWHLDWASALLALSEDPDPPAARSIRFHRALAEGIVQVAREAGRSLVGLSGGCFQNQLLSRLTCQRLRESGFEPLEHRRIPPNDGGIAFGQAVAARTGVRWEAG